MTTIQQVNNIPVKSLDKNSKKDSLFVFSSNPLTDATVWGIGGAACSPIASVYGQKQTLNNPEKLKMRIASIKDEIKLSEGKKSNIKSLQHSLECLERGKINIKSLHKWAIGLGLVMFIPQLVINSVIWAGKKGYDKVKQSS